jgi:hypothetical protein
VFFWGRGIVCGMDPLTFATSFSAVAGLLHDFVSSRQAGEAQSIDEYVDWLRRHEHQQLADAIAGNADLSRSIQTLLVGQHDAVMSKLNELDKIFASVARNLEDFAGIAAAVNPESLLSEQAVSVLRQINKAGASFFVESQSMRGTSDPHYIIIDGQRCDLEYTEPRFIKDDIDVLCALNLLRAEMWGDSISYRITRAGDKLGTLSP